MTPDKLPLRAYQEPSCRTSVTGGGVITWLDDPTPFKQDTTTTCPVCGSFLQMIPETFDRVGPLVFYVHQSEYDYFESEGCDMRNFHLIQPIPTTCPVSKED